MCVCTRYTGLHLLVAMLRHDQESLLSACSSSVAFDGRLVSKMTFDLSRDT